MSISTSVEINSPSVRRANYMSILSLFKKIPGKVVIAILAVVAVFGLYSIISNMSATPSKSLVLNQKFDVVAKTQDGKTTNGKLAIQVTGAQKAVSMLVQGSTVTARNNKVFLIINMDITNPYLLPLYTYPVDSFRLVGADGKKYSPTTHQGNVEVRPESTRTSNVGFIVPKDQKRFKVEVGDISADKIVLEFSL
jgi:hypothetical protein